MSCCRFLTLPTLTPLPSLSSYRVTRGPTTALTTLAPPPGAGRGPARAPAASPDPPRRAPRPADGPDGPRLHAEVRQRLREALARPLGVVLGDPAAEVEDAERRRRVLARLHGAPRFQ